MRTLPTLDYDYRSLKDLIPASALESDTGKYSVQINLTLTYKIIMNILAFIGYISLPYLLVQYIAAAKT